MKFENLLEVDRSKLLTIKADIFFFGEPLDDRGKFVVSALQENLSPNKVIIKFDASKMTFTINGLNVPLRDFSSHLSKISPEYIAGQIVVDATTLGVSELLYILRWALRVELKANIIYAEPKSYPSVFDATSDYGRHHFNLSSSSVGYRALPGFTRTTSTVKKAHLIALLGFERVRLGQLLQNDEGAFIEAVTPIFGVPSFRPSFDKHSAYQNIDRLVRVSDKPEFCCASNPFETFRKLKFIKRCLPDKVLHVAPIGTKPMAIGACLFILNNLNENVGLMYDHPINSKGRSRGVTKIHLYEISFA